MIDAQKIEKLLFESPGAKAFINVILPIMSGFFSGVFTAQITGAKGLEWWRWYEAWGVYALIAILVILFFYTRASYRKEARVLDFADADYCIAYMRSKCLPEAAEKYKEIIRTGNGGELMQVMTELKKSLK